MVAKVGCVWRVDSAGAVEVDAEAEVPARSQYVEIIDS